MATLGEGIWPVEPRSGMRSSSVYDLPTSRTMSLALDSVTKVAGQLASVPDLTKAMRGLDTMNRAYGPRITEMQRAVERYNEASGLRIAEMQRAVEKYNQASGLRITEMQRAVERYNQTSGLRIAEMQRAVARYNQTSGLRIAEMQWAVERYNQTSGLRIVEMQRASSARQFVSTARVGESFLETQFVSLARLRESLAAMQGIGISRPALEELQALFEQPSQVDDASESPDSRLDSPVDTEGALAALDQAKLNLLFFMFVLWVRATPYLSTNDIAEFARWWVEFVAVLLSGQ